MLGNRWSFPKITGLDDFVRAVISEINDTQTGGTIGLTTLVEKLYFKDLSTPPIGNILLKVLDQVLYFKDSGDTSAIQIITSLIDEVVGTFDGRDLSVDGTKLDGIESGATADQTEAEILTLLGLTSVEVDQLGNIGATTISATQWGYLGALDQSLTQASSPTFAGLTLADGGSLSLQEDITFTGATTENLIKMPDNLLDALSIQEGSNKYVTFDTVNDEEDILFYKSVDILHTSTHADDHALEIDTDAAGYGDVKALDIDYITGNITAGEDEGILLINIDRTLAIGGDIFALEVLATDQVTGSTGIYGLKIGAEIGPVHQDSGTFANPTKGTDNTIGSSVTKTSIGFTQSPDTITDSSNGFGNFVVGEIVVVTGATTPANNTTYTITVATVGALTVTPQPDTVEDDSASITVEGNVAIMLDGSLGTTTDIFEANGEYILIGAAAAFEEIEFIVATGASGAGIKPTFWYSTAGSHTFTQFTPVDGTDGFKHTGVVAWDQSDLSSHAINTDTGTYDIKVIRTRNSLTTSPVLGYAKTAATTEYIWDENGDVNIRNLIISDAGNIGSASDTDAIAIASGGEVTLSQTLILSDVVDAATDTDKFLVLDGSNNVDFRTGASVLSDIGAQSSEEANVIRDNITLNAWRIATQHALSVLKMEDGIIDVFTDETGIDTANCINQSYNSTGDYYEPVGTGGDIFSYVLDVDSTRDNTAMRTIIPAKDISASASIVKVTFEARSDIALEVIKAYIGHPAGAGDPYDFDGNQVELKFGGGSGFSIGVGETIVSDQTTFALDNSKNIIISFDTDTEGNMRLKITGDGDYKGYYKSATAEAEVTNVTGYTLNSGWLSSVNNIESITALENMTLISESWEAEAEPTESRLQFLMEDVDAATINTDILGYVSLDDGANWETVTLVDEGDFETGKKIIAGTKTLTDRNDQTMVYKIVTANNKHIKIHRTGQFVK
ncbi:hypothetical protein LCGC14_0399370 [marine sediment metagenome]|uniref:Uncharacterized protein n=1 Tax=marine sediment metagenome TaxID=412755 RepID=A0A0F9VJB4_9ZZZZ